MWNAAVDDDNPAAAAAADDEDVDVNFSFFFQFINVYCLIDNRTQHSSYNHI